MFKKIYKVIATTTNAIKKKYYIIFLNFFLLDINIRSLNFNFIHYYFLKDLDFFHASFNLILFSLITFLEPLIKNFFFLI